MLYASKSLKEYNLKYHDKLSKLDPSISSLLLISQTDQLDLERVILTNKLAEI